MEIKAIDYSYTQQEKALSLAIGFFDGVHLGHRLLLSETRKNPSLTSAVLTFSPSMKSTLGPESLPLLLSETEKEKSIASFGIQEYLLLSFSDEVRNSTVPAFLSFLRGLHAKEIVVGADFRFGRSALGSAEDLKALEKDGIRVKVLDLLTAGGEKISTTEIRRFLEAGDLARANQLLGYSYFLEGTVVHGLENGRKLGYPTANLDEDPTLVKLPDGVYKTLTEVDGKAYRSMTNIGNHPTIQALSHRIIETNLFDFSGDLYGKTIKVIFLRYLRKQVKFHTLERLKDAMAEDKKNALK
jgi:riboflavin kinase/FMN adenylyltransferase